MIYDFGAFRTMARATIDAWGRPTWRNWTAAPGYERCGEVIALTLVEG